MPTATDPANTVLVYTYADVIGDGFVKLPFVADLRARFPGARITWCSGVLPTVYAGVLAPLTEGFLDEVISAAGLGAGWTELLSPKAPLGGRRFDVVICTDRGVLRTLCARRVRHGLFISGAANFRLSDRRPPKDWKRPAHLRDYLTGLLDLAAPPPARPAAMDLPVPEDFRRAAAERLPDGPCYVGISPGAGEKACIWPLAKFIEVARDQAGKGRVPVFLLGPEEAHWLEDLRAAVPEARFPEWEGGTTGPRGPVFVVALAKRLAAAAANDSGAGHMLAAGGAPLVSLFSRHDARKYSARSPRQVIIDSKDYGGNDPALIPADAVIAALDRLIKTDGGTHGGKSDQHGGNHRAR